jgi:hypothetical protein
MVPNSWEGFEIRRSVFCLAFRAIEGDGLTGKGFGADEIARFAVENGTARGVVGVDGHAETADLDLPAVDGG